MFDNEPTVDNLFDAEIEMRELDVDSDEWVDEILKGLSPADLG